MFGVAVSSEPRLALPSQQQRSQYYYGYQDSTPWTICSISIFPYALMQTFPEGFITGTVLALLVVYKPEWVATFRDEFYLHHRHPRDAHHLPKRRSSDD